MPGAPVVSSADCCVEKRRLVGEEGSEDGRGLSTPAAWSALSNSSMFVLDLAFSSIPQCAKVESRGTMELVVVAERRRRRMRRSGMEGGWWRGLYMLDRDRAIILRSRSYSLKVP